MKSHVKIYAVRRVIFNASVCKRLRKHQAFAAAPRRELATEWSLMLAYGKTAGITPRNSSFRRSSSRLTRFGNARCRFYPQKETRVTYGNAAGQLWQFYVHRLQSSGLAFPPAPSPSRALSTTLPATRRQPPERAPRLASHCFLLV